ncbi:hypothetical protein [Variovorax sp. dw_954]|uniref:hypothetical protein n=1 Tax=Variovorax sp. dw_954 TaxID=2720078 RepID=UPI001BD4225B|nr:hypothetical protein [Variovorax sp. dw_954]
MTSDNKYASEQSGRSSWAPGPSGRLLFIELEKRGIDCPVVEKNARAGAAPRAPRFTTPSD